MRIGHLGPAGTFSEEAARDAAQAHDAELVPCATVRETISVLLNGAVERAIVPIENSLEGTINATVDALSAEPGLCIVGEHVLSVTQCLIAREQIALDTIEAVHSHPQGLAQCARFLHEQLPSAQQLTASSTAAAVRGLLDAPLSNAAIASRFAAELHGVVVLREAIEDDPGNETRFVWLARSDEPEPFPAPSADAPWKTSIVFQGSGDTTPGWLVRCLSEFAFRGVNLVKIESRPARSRLGHYIFLVDCEGPLSSDAVTDAIENVVVHCDLLRVLGSYPAAART
jgi:prephenate dehydratase